MTVLSEDTIGFSRMESQLLPNKWHANLRYHRLSPAVSLSFCLALARRTVTRKSFILYRAQYTSCALIMSKSASHYIFARIYYESNICHEAPSTAYIMRITRREFFEARAKYVNKEFRLCYFWAHFVVL